MNVYGNELTTFGKSSTALIRDLISVGIVVRVAVPKYEIDKVDISLAASANLLNCALASTLPLPASTLAEILASTNSLSFLFLA